MGWLLRSLDFNDRSTWGKGYRDLSVEINKATRLVDCDQIRMRLLKIGFEKCKWQRAQSEASSEVAYSIGTLQASDVSQKPETI